MRVNIIAIFAASLYLMALPIHVYAYGYGCAYGYAEGIYYSQGTYYAQGTYQTTITTDVAVAGNFAGLKSISKGSGTFVIDHPLDPANKLLYHSFVESPDVKNMYDGVVVLDRSGEAIVRLPPYFDALNTNVRYQLKPIGAPMPNLHVKSEEKNNQFTIGGGAAGGKVSWQITGTRHDPYIVANPIIPEVEKGPDQLARKGEYLFDATTADDASKNGWLSSFGGWFAQLFAGE